MASKYANQIIWAPVEGLIYNVYQSVTWGRVLYKFDTLKEPFSLSHIPNGLINRIRAKKRI